LGIPHREIVPQKVSENPAEKRGVEDLLCKSSPLRGLKTFQRFKGTRSEKMHEHLLCLTRWGREGVTLLTAGEYK
jgi:hypothetical protein